MAFYSIVFSLLVLSVVQCFTTSVPVFLWGDLPDSSLEANPLVQVSGDAFKSVLAKELKTDPFTVVFIEETLSVEDFSSKDSEGATPYPYLSSQIDNSFYLPSVDDAVEALDTLADPENVDHVKLTENGLSAEIEPGTAKFLFINLNDAREGESRSDLLRRHNDFMEDMFTKLKTKYKTVVAVYTAQYPSWIVPETHSRVRRQATTAGTFYDLERVLMYASTITLNDGTNTVPLSGITGHTTAFNTTDGMLNTTMNFGDNSVTLNFNSLGGYWFLNMITLATPAVTEILYPESEIFAILGFAYRCSQNVTYKTTVNETKDYSLSFGDLKIQPFFGPNGTEKHEFGDSFNCVGFFSAPIWAGLFIVFILLAITFYGIMMMLDIRTMDRFDDPKGKTITINAVGE